MRLKFWPNVTPLPKWNSRSSKSTTWRASKPFSSTSTLDCRLDWKTLGTEITSSGLPARCWHRCFRCFMNRGSSLKRLKECSISRQGWCTILLDKESSPRKTKEERMRMAWMTISICKWLRNVCSTMKRTQKFKRLFKMRTWADKLKSGSHTIWIPASDSTH